MSVEQQYRDRILAIYNQASPDKASNVDKLLAQHRGREHELYSNICLKYGLQPEAEVEALVCGQHSQADARQLNRDRILAICSESSPQKFSYVIDLLVAKHQGKEYELYRDICAKYNIAPEPDNVVLNTSTPDAALPGKAVTVNSLATPSTDPHVPQPYREQIIQVLRLKNPAQLREIDSMMFEYEGRERALFTKLCGKYSITEEQLVPASDIPGASSTSPNSVAPVEVSMARHLEESREGAEVPPAIYASMIEAIYASHNPQKLQSVEKLMTDHAGKERQLYLDICKKYGLSVADDLKDDKETQATISSQNPSGSHAGSASVTDRAPVVQEYKSRISAIYCDQQAQSSDASRESSLTQRLSKVDPLLAQHYGREHEIYLKICAKYGVAPEQEISELSGTTPPAADGNETKSLSSSSLAADTGNRPPPVQTADIAWYRDRIAAIYREEKPEKLSELDGALEQFRGRESELYALVLAKYRPVNAVPEAPTPSAEPSLGPESRGDGACSRCGGTGRVGVLGPAGLGVASKDCDCGLSSRAGLHSPILARSGTLVSQVGSRLASVGSGLLARSQSARFPREPRDPEADPKVPELTAAQREEFIERCRSTATKDGFRGLPEVARADKEVVMAAVREDGRSLQFASEALRGDTEVAVAAFRQLGVPGLYDQMPLRAIYLAAINHRQDFAFVHKSGEWLLHAPAVLREDRELVVAALCQWNIAGLHADMELRDMYLAAVRYSGDWLQYAPDNLRADREVARAAVKQSPSALKWVMGGLHQDEGLLRSIGLVSDLFELSSSSRSSRPVVVLSVRSGKAASSPFSAVVQQRLVNNAFFKAFVCCNPIVTCKSFCGPYEQSSDSGFSCRGECGMLCKYDWNFDTWGVECEPEGVNGVRCKERQGGSPTPHSCWRLAFRWHLERAKASGGFLLQVVEPAVQDGPQPSSECTLAAEQEVELCLAQAVGVHVFRISTHERWQPGKEQTLEKAIEVLQGEVQSWQGEQDAQAIDLKLTRSAG